MPDAAVGGVNAGGGRGIQVLQDLKHLTAQPHGVVEGELEVLAPLAGLGSPEADLLAGRVQKGGQRGRFGLLQEGFLQRLQGGLLLVQVEDAGGEAGLPFAGLAQPFQRRNAFVYLEGRLLQPLLVVQAQGFDLGFEAVV